MPGCRRAPGFSQVDVLTAEPFLGNPVVVVLDGAGVTAEEMQRVDVRALSAGSQMLAPWWG